jgi:zinc transport system substrate-binding protein
MNRILLLFLVALTFAACDTVDKPSKPVIAVSIVPQEYLVRSLIDTLAEVQVMVPPGASPATWEATPSEMKALADAIIYYKIGHIGFEKAWMPEIREQNPELTMIDLSTSLKIRRIEHRHNDHKHSGYDPHTWMSPANMESMARQIYGDMMRLFPEQKEMIRDNYAALLSEIKQSNFYARRMLTNYEGRSFLVFHPSLGYFADEYGLEQLTIEFEGKEPSASYLKEIIDLAREKGIKTIFVQKEFDTRNAQVIAEELNAKVKIVEPLSANWPDAIKKLTDNLVASFNE